MRKVIIILTIGLWPLLATRAQDAQVNLANLIRAKLGEKCIVKDGSGKQISFEDLAGKIIEGAMMGKRVKYYPLKVVEGVNYEVEYKIIDPASIKPIFDEIDFSNTALGFFNQNKVKIDQEEFKKTIQSNSNLVASAFNADNGKVLDYYIIPKPKPAAIQVVTNGDSPAQIATINNGTGSLTTANFENKGSNIFEVGNKMPDFKVTDINGKKWNSKDLKDKIIVVNFWFIECPPCIAEISSLNKLVDKYKENDKVIFLSMADSEKTKIQKFLTNRTFKYSHIAREEAKKYLNEWGINMYPQNIVINNRKVTFSFSGGTNMNDEFIFNALNDEIEKCLKS